MRHKKFATLITLIMSGAVALSACSGGDSSPGQATQDTAQETQGSQEEPSRDDESGVDFLRGTNKSVNADQTSGDLAPAAAAPEVKAKWVQLRVGDAGGLEPAVVNGAGRSIYWFSDDPVGGRVSNCNGDCEKKWPPVVVDKGGKVIFSGVKRENISFVKRTDGRSQVAIGGRPIYLFSGDAKAGDINGQNSGGKWFVINPEGKRATPGAEAPAPNPDPAAAPGAKPARSVTFFSGKNFDDFSGSNFSTGAKVSKSCADLRRGFQSLTTDGAVKIWSEPGCKGKSAVVTDDVPNAAALGFPKGVQSYIGS